MLFQTEKTIATATKPEVESGRKILNECLRNSMNFRNQNANLAKIELNSSTRKDVLIYTYQYTDILFPDTLMYERNNEET